MNLGWHQVCLNQKKSGDYRSGRYVSDWISFLWCPPFNVFVGRSRFAAYVVISSCCIGVFLGHAPMICIHSSHSPPIQFTFVLFVLSYSVIHGGCTALSVDDITVSLVTFIILRWPMKFLILSLSCCLGQSPRVSSSRSCNPSRC